MAAWRQSPLAALVGITVFFFGGGGGATCRFDRLCRHVKVTRRRSVMSPGLWPTTSVGGHRLSLTVCWPWPFFSPGAKFNFNFIGRTNFFCVWWSPSPDGVDVDLISIHFDGNVGLLGLWRLSEFWFLAVPWRKYGNQLTLIDGFLERTATLVLGRSWLDRVLVDDSREMNERRVAH